MKEVEYRLFNFKIINLYSFFFFFQAEDGIRDIGVTGVQTCALPISGTYYCRPDLKERLHLFGLMIELNGWLLSLITF